MKQYSLVGQNGNAYNIMGYVSNAMRQCNFTKAEMDEYIERASSDDYHHLLVVSTEYLDKCNIKMILTHDEDEDDYED